MKLNKSKVFYTIMITLIIGLVAIIGIKFYKDFIKENDKEVVVKTKLDNLDAYGYSLDDLDTELYKEYFIDLKSVLTEDKVDYEEYAKALVKLFVTDFYTLDNKITSGDIGGTEFLHVDLVDNFKMNAGDTIYNHVKSNVSGERNQELPIVKEVEVLNVEETTYKYNDKNYDGYIVKCSWTYEKDLGYDSSKTYTLIKDNNKLNIVVGD